LRLTLIQNEINEHVLTTIFKKSVLLVNIRKHPLMHYLKQETKICYLKYEVFFPKYEVHSEFYTPTPSDFKEINGQRYRVVIKIL